MSKNKLTYSNIIRTAVDAVYDDEKIKNWCIEKYGVPPSVRGGMDPLTPVQESDCPVIAFAPVGGERGQDRDLYLRGFIVRVAVSDTEQEIERDAATGRILKQLYKGTDNVSYLLEELVYNALKKKFNYLGFPVSTADEQIDEMQHTLFEAKAGITIFFELAIGEDYPFLV